MAVATRRARAAIARPFAMVHGARAGRASKTISLTMPRWKLRRAPALALAPAFGPADSIFGLTTRHQLVRRCRGIPVAHLQGCSAIHTTDAAIIVLATQLPTAWNFKMECSSARLEVVTPTSWATTALPLAPQLQVCWFVLRASMTTTTLGEPLHPALELQTDKGPATWRRDSAPRKWGPRPTLLVLFIAASTRMVKSRSNQIVLPALIVLAPHKKLPKLLLASASQPQKQHH